MDCPVVIAYTGTNNLGIGIGAVKQAYEVNTVYYNTTFTPERPHVSGNSVDLTAALRGGLGYKF